MARTVALTGPQELAYVRSRATALGDDPNAVVAVGEAEGGFPGSVGDQGTSFGPFQLHQGGALPSGLSGAAANLWANSKAGLDYALAKITSVAKGLTGTPAVDAIVTKFERPADGGAGDESRAADYMLQNPAPARNGKGFKWSGVSTAGVKPTLLASVQQAVLAVGGVGVNVTSGKRAPGVGNDVSDSNHITGDALDGYAVFADGHQEPLGAALLKVASSYGLRSGDVAGFDPAKPGGYDSVHVDDGANVGGVSGGAATTTPLSPSRNRPSGADIVSALDLAADPVDAIWSKIFGGNISSIADVFKGLIWLMKPSSWLRAVEFVTGMLLLLLSAVGLGVVFVQRNAAVGAAADVASALPGPVGVAGKAVTTVRRPRQAVRRHVQAGQRRERDTLDAYYSGRADELDPRRRARIEQRELRQQETRERVDAARSRIKTPGAANEGSLGEFGFG